MKKSNNKKILDKVISVLCIVFCVILVPIFIANVILIIKGVINKDELPSLFSISPLAVETDSMYPVFTGGDLLLIKKCTADEVENGDIISYYEPTVADHSVIVTHRVIEVLEKSDGTKVFYTKGDANNSQDSQTIGSDKIIGKYLYHIDNLGRFVMYLSTTEGMLVCVVLPICVLIGLDYIIKLFDKRKKDNE